MESVYQAVPKCMFKHAILAGRGMLTMSRDILICHVSTLITYHPLNNKTVASFNGVQHSLSQHSVNSQHRNMCARHCHSHNTACSGQHCTRVPFYVLVCSFWPWKRKSEWRSTVHCVQSFPPSLGSNKLKAVLWITFSSATLRVRVKSADWLKVKLSTLCKINLTATKISHKVATVC